jgi:hypothetical protein
MLARPPVTLLPTASLEDIFNVLANVSPSSMQMGVDLLNDMIGDLPADLPLNSVDVLDPLEIDASALAFPADPQQLLWDELMVELFVGFSKNFIQNIRIALAQLTAMDSNS